MFLSKLRKYIVNHLGWFIVSTAATVASTYINIYIPQLSGQAVRNILEIQDYNMLVSLVIQILALTGVLAVLSLVQRYTNGYFSQKVVFDIRNDLFKSLQRQSFGFFDKMKTGQLMSRATTDVDRIRGFVGFMLRMLIDSIFLLVAIIIAMVMINQELSLVTFSVVPILFVGFSLFGRKIRPIIQTSREYFGALTSVLWENITGIRVVRSFAREDYENSKFHTPNENYYNTMMKAVKIRTIFDPFNSFMVGLAIAAIYWYGGFQIIEGRFTVDQLYVFAAYMYLLIRPIAMMGMIWTGYQRMAAAGERVFEIIDAVPEVRDKPDAASLSNVEGDVTFENVFFGYSEDKPILKGISLQVKPGKTIALLGPTGSGKSTIIRLLPRFYDVTSGRILIDGRDIRDIRAQSLRKQMGIVSQETYLFNMTVKENIAYGKPDATMDEIVKVAQIAKAHEFIVRLPNGYDTMVGERGVTLSGGQQQRVAIARALLMDPKILILDDSTSSVDVDTEYEIQQALNALFRNRTTFVITQRLSTIRNADKIIVLGDGQIVEEGTHKTLMEKKGAYYKIYQTLYEAQKETTKIGKDASDLATQRTKHKPQKKEGI